MTNLPQELQSAMREWQAVTDDLVAIARAFDPARWDESSACGGWTNRQLLVHLATGYNVRMAVLQSVVDGTSAPEIDADAANADNVERLAGAPVDEIVFELTRTRGRALVLLSRITAERLDLATSLGGGKPLREALPALSQHDLEHAAELRG
jgi:uncharacterized protein (TIGR03083 family)